MILTDVIQITFTETQVLTWGGSPIHYLYGYVPPKGVVILKQTVVLLLHPRTEYKKLAYF